MQGYPGAYPTAPAAAPAPGAPILVQCSTCRNTIQLTPGAPTCMCPYCHAVVQNPQAIANYGKQMYMQGLQPAPQYPAPGQYPGAPMYAPPPRPQTTVIIGAPSHGHGGHGYGGGYGYPGHKMKHKHYKHKGYKGFKMFKGGKYKHGKHKHKGFKFF